MKATLRYSSKGGSVVELQTKLNALMPEATPPLVPDGVYGGKTVQRVKLFQAKRGLVADCIVGPKTWDAIEGTAPPKPGAKAFPSPPKPELKGKPVHIGTKLYCSCGSARSTLVFFDPSRTVATVNDHNLYGNIIPFGQCGSPGNPRVAWMSQITGEYSTAPCAGSAFFPHPWTPGLPIEKVGSPPAAALDRNSILMCIWGGTISIRH